MLAAEIPPQEIKPKRKSSVPKPEVFSSNTDASFGPPKASKEIPKKSADDRGSVSFLRKNLEAKKSSKTSDEVLSSLGDLAKIENERTEGERNISDAIQGLELIEASRVAPSTLVDMPAILPKSETFKSKNNVSDLDEALGDIAKIERDRILKLNETKESLEKLPKHDTIAELDIIQVHELENIQLWKDAQPYIAKNIDDLKRVMEERAIFEGLPKKMQTPEARQKIDKASAVIQSNYEKLRSKLAASDAELVKIYKEHASQEIEDRVRKLFPVFRDTGLQGLSEEDALVYRIDATRSLMNDYTDNPKRTEAYTQIATELNKQRRELTSKRLSTYEETDEKVGKYKSSVKGETQKPKIGDSKPSMERSIDRMKEDLMAIELEVSGLRAIDDARSKELIPILLKQQETIREQLSRASEKDFFAKNAASSEDDSLESFADNDIDVREKLIRAALAKHPDNTVLVSEANRRLAAIAKQREEITEVLSRRNVSINYGETSYPKTMGTADRGVSTSVMRGSVGETLGSKAEREKQQQRDLSPFVAMENFINRTRTENLFSDGDYLPGILRQQYIQLMEARKKSLSEGKNDEVKEIDRVANGITSALRNMDLDRINEALGTIQSRLDQATEKYNENAANPEAAAPWREKIRTYQEQLSEASHDAGDFLSRAVDGRLASLGITEEDYKTIRFGKVSLFSNARLWWIKTRHGGEIAKISTMMKRRNELQGRQDGQKL